MSMPDVVSDLIEALENAKQDLGEALLSEVWVDYNSIEIEQFVEFVHSLYSVAGKTRELFDKALWKNHAEGNLTQYHSVRKQSDSDTPRGRKPMTLQEKAAKLFG